MIESYPEIDEMPQEAVYSTAGGKMLMTID